MPRESKELRQSSLELFEMNLRHAREDLAYCIKYNLCAETLRMQAICEWIVDHGRSYAIGTRVYERPAE